MKIKSLQTLKNIFEKVKNMDNSIYELRFLLNLSNVEHHNELQLNIVLQNEIAESDQLIFQCAETFKRKFIFHNNENKIEYFPAGNLGHTETFEVS